MKMTRIEWALVLCFVLASAAADGQVPPFRGDPSRVVTSTAVRSQIKANVTLTSSNPTSNLTVNVAPGSAPAFLLPVMRNCFSGGNETFGLMYTTDNFATEHDLFSGDLATAVGGLRDPCLFHFNGVWYCACTLNAWGSSCASFRILTDSGTGLATWTALADITVGNAIQYTWAPKFFYDTKTNRLYISITRDNNPAVGAHNPYLAYASLSDLTTWSTWTLIPSLQGPAQDYIDFQIASDGVYYYATGVAQQSAPSLRIYRSTKIDSGYSLFSSFDFGDGQYAEQCWLEWLGGTNWQIFYFITVEAKTYCRNSNDGMATWSDPVLANDCSSSAKSFACPFRLQPVPVLGQPGQPDQPGQMRMTFGPVVGGNSYSVQVCNDLAIGAWSPLTATDQADNGGWRTITDLNATGAQKFYRVQITSP